MTQLQTDRTEQLLDLAGAWSLRLDPDDRGADEAWAASPLGGEPCALPGSIQTQGFGDEPAANGPWIIATGAGMLDDPRFADANPADATDGYRCPFWMTPPKTYVGPAWFQRTVDVPDAFAAQRLTLTLERAHWRTTLYIDGEHLGTRDSLAVAHAYDVSDALTPGRHTLTLCVDNRYHVNVGKDSHAISDQTQSNWNGVVGRLTLTAQPAVCLDDAHCFPDPDTGDTRVRLTLTNRTGAPCRATVTLDAACTHDGLTHAAQHTATLNLPADPTHTVELTLQLGTDCLRWSEHHPAVYTLTTTLASDAGTDRRETRFGVRRFHVVDPAHGAGKQFAVNGQRVFLRGTLECAVFPATGYPPTGVEHWRGLFTHLQGFGLNHVRFHSWCPPEAAFDAADELGVFVQVEGSCWADYGAGDLVDAWVADESRRIFRAYGNHPSFVLYTPSNEPGPHGEARDAFLGGLMDDFRALDDRRLYTAGAGWPRIDASDFHIQQDTRMQLFDGLRIDQPPRTDADYGPAVDAADVPLVSHEIAQWCVYPDFDEQPHPGDALEPRYLDVYRQRLEASGQGHLGDAFRDASGRLQVQLYKAETEAALRSPGFAGFQLLGLADFPGQGFAPVGMLDARWRCKAYHSAELNRRACDDVVPLARMDRRVWTNDTPIHAAIDVCNYGPSDLRRATVAWRLVDPEGQTTIESGAFLADTITQGGLTRVGEINVDTATITGPRRLSLVVSVEGTPASNDWSLWVFPANDPEPETPGVHVATVFDDDTRRRLAAGERVLLLPAAHRVAGGTLGTFGPIFWNRVMFTGQRTHTTGALVRPEDPALAGFPTESFADWHWFDLLQGSQPMILDGLPVDLAPAVQPIDDWTLCRRLGHVFEARVGDGRLLVCSLNLAGPREHGETRYDSAVARCMLNSLKRYAASDAFAPSVPVTPEQVAGLFRELPPMRAMLAVADADSGHTGHEADRAIDGDPDTFWHTRWSPVAPLPHRLSIRLPEPRVVTGLTYSPRSDDSRGRIADYEVRTSDDGRTWSEPVAAGTWPDSAEDQTLTFDPPLRTAHVQLVARSEVNGDEYAAVSSLILHTEA